MARRHIPDSREKPFLRRFPQARYWLERGLHPRAARELVKAGFRSVEDLAGATREDLTALPGVGERSLAELARLRGSPITSPADFWLKRGLRPRVARSLARQGIDSLETLEQLTREQFLALPGVEKASLRAVEAVLGHPLDSPVREWRRQGLRSIAAHLLATAGIRTVAELAKLGATALQRLGLGPADLAVCGRLVREHQKRTS